jgi:hypothetical protein
MGVEVLSTLLLVGARVFAQPPDVLWTRSFGGDSVDFCGDVQQTTDGGYVLAGYTCSYGAGQSDVWLIKTDANGDSLWSRTYGGPENEYSRAVLQTSDGDYLLTGDTYAAGSGGDRDFWLVKTDANGDTLWSRAYDGGGPDQCYSVQETSDGGYIISGNTFSYHHANDFWLLKTDANGEILWSRTFGGSGMDNGRFAQQTTDGGYVIMGTTSSYGAGDWDFWLLKTDANGDSLWSRTFGGESQESCKDGQQTSDGGYILAGYTDSFGPEGQNLWIVKTDTNGDSLWSRVLAEDPYTWDWCLSIQQTWDGGYILGGETNFLLVKTDTDGHILWHLTFDQGVEERCFSVKQTADGGYIATGGCGTWSDDWNAFVVKVGPESPYGAIGVDPEWLDFGSVPVGESQALALTIASTGTADLVISNIGAPQDFSTDFTGPQTLPPGEEMAVQVDFRPTAGQEYTGNLMILSNAPNSPTIVALVGQGLQSAISVDPIALNFGSVSVGDSSSLTLTISSTGGTDLTVMDVTVPATFSTDFTGPQTIPPSAQIPVQVTFSPDSARVYWDSLYIISDAPSSPTAVLSTGVGIGSGADDIAPMLPDEYYLYTNYPNPFNSTTTIRYDVNQMGPVELTVFDLLGREVAKLASGQHLAGSYTITWNAANLPSGTYLCRMNAGAFSQTQKVMLVK